ncbi:MAG: MFS transporter [Lachnospiraceae bacterium]
MGLGCSVSFLAILKISSHWFEEKVFCTMSGVTCFVGMMGAMAAQAPMAALGRLLAWQTIYRGLGGFIIVVAVLVLLVVRDTPQMLGYAPVASAQDSAGEERSPSFSVMQAVKSVVKNKWTWPPFISYGCFYGAYIIVSGFYGSSMLQSFYGCDAVAASSVITFVVLGCAAGSVVVDIAADRLHERRRPQLLCGSLFLASWIALLLLMGKGSLLLMYPVFFALGFFSTGYAVCWSAVKECNDKEYVGISTSIANMGGYLGSIIVPTVAGQIYSSSVNAGEQAAYQYVLIGAAMITVIGLAASWLLKETYGQNIYQKKYKN